MAQRTVVKTDRGVVRRVFSDTPHQLKLLTAGLAAAAVLLGFVYALALGRDSSSFADLKARTAEVSATSDLYYELNDMDAQAANALLVGYHPADPSMVPASVNAVSSDTVYEHDRSGADADLQQIARNVQLTAQAQKLLDNLGTYEALIAQALYIDENTQNEQPAAPPAAALALYTRASALLHSTLLPTSIQITDTDSTAVNGSYSGDHSAMTDYGYVLLVLALLTGSAMYLGNRYHARKFRRRLGPLALAVVVAVVLGITGLTTQLTEADHLHYAKQDAYDSINALARAEAISDDANADESRWLLEGRSSALQASYFEKISEVAGVAGVSAQDAGNDPTTYYSGLSNAVGGVHLDAAANSVSGVTLSGYLGTELNNITFPSEAQAAYAATQAFNTYVQDDNTIRADADRGDLAAAVAFDIGTQQARSNYAFNQYMTDLGTVIHINDTYFAAGISAGQGDLGGLTWATMVTGELLLLVFVLQAGYLRLREYR